MGAEVAIGLQVLSSVSSFAAGRAQARAEEQAGEQRSRELRLQEQAEKTRAAQEELAREERLRSILAAQRTAFGAAGISSASGTPLNIQQQAASASQRQQRIADLNEFQTTAALNIQAQQEARAGEFRGAQARSAATRSLLTGLGRAGTTAQRAGFFGESK